MKDLVLEGNGTPVVLARNSKNLTVGATAGSLRVSATGVTYPVSSPVEGTAAATVASSGTITVASEWHRITTAGAVTGVILTAGTVHGQELTISLDKDAAGSVTFAAAGTSRVGTGVSAVIAVGGLKKFRWDNTDLIWAAA
jgi:hypothetical protein